MNIRLRKFFGTILMFTFLAVYALLAMGLMGSFERPHFLIEVLLYIVIGIAWIIPIKPLFMWMIKKD